MPSKRKAEARRRAAEKKAGQSKGTGRSSYAVKRERMASGWHNPRSPLRRLDESTLTREVLSERTPMIAPTKT